MKAEEIVGRIFEACDLLGIPYVLVGSFASNVYGIPRSTKDADFVVQTAPGQFSQLMAALGPNFVRVLRFSLKRSLAQRRS
jgi:hypothetical protein